MRRPKSRQAKDEMLPPYESLNVLFKWRLNEAEVVNQEDAMRKT